MTENVALKSKNEEIAKVASKENEHLTIELADAQKLIHGYEVQERIAVYAESLRTPNGPRCEVITSDKARYINEPLHLVFISASLAKRWFAQFTYRTRSPLKIHVPNATEQDKVEIRRLYDEMYSWQISLESALIFFTV